MTDVPAVEAVSLLEVGSLTNYLKRVCPALLDVDSAVFDPIVGSPATQEKLRTFISDLKTPVLVVQKEDVDNEENKVPRISFQLEVRFAGNKAWTVAFIKRQGETTLEQTRSVASQLHVINMGEGSPFESLHSYVHNSFVPFFRSYLKQEFPNDKDAKSGTLLTIPFFFSPPTLLLTVTWL